MKLDNLNADEFQNAMCLLADVAEDVMNGELGAKAKASYAKFRSDSAKAKAKATAKAKGDPEAAKAAATAEVDAASAHRAHWVQLAVEWLNDTFDFHLA